jgi:hypothetical protein
VANQKTLAEQFYATRETDFDETFWNRFLNDVTARFKELEKIKIDWDALTDDALEVALERINEVLGPAAERIQNIASLGFLSVDSASSRTLALGVVSFEAVAGDQLDLFVPTPFVAVTRATNPYDFAIGRVVYFNRADRIIDIDIVYFEGNPGPHNDWTIAAVAGQALAQTSLLNQTVAAKDDTLTAKQAVLDVQADVTTKHNTVVDLHTDFRLAIAPSGPTSPITPVVGQFWYDGEIVRVFDGDGWSPAVTASIGGIRTEEGTFGVSPTGVITVGGGFSFAMVWLNGLLLKEGTDYTAATPTITISGAVAGDEYMVWAYQANDPTDYYTKEETNGLLAAKADATATANALAKRVRVDAAQTFTEAEKGQAKANLEVGILAGHRNKLMNGNFGFWQRGFGPFTASGYTADRWRLEPGTGSSNSVSKADFVADDNLPFVDKFTLAWTRTVAGSTSSFLLQKIEGARTLAGKLCTVSVWARATVATKLRVSVQQRFGTGGSATESYAAASEMVFAGGGPLIRYDFTFQLNGIASKIFGSGSDDALWVLFEWLNTDPNATIAISHVSIVEGDATKERNPFANRDLALEELLVKRYFEIVVMYARFYATGGGQILNVPGFWQTKRTVPAAIFRGLQSGGNLSADSWADISVNNGGRFEVIAGGAGDTYALGAYYGMEADL